MEDLIGRREGERLSAIYPEEDHDIMPTRLGNVLRTLESNAGAQYALNEIIVLPRLQAIMPKEQADFLDDQRQEMDIGVRMTLTWLLATAITILFLWSKGIWLAAAAIPYGLAYVSYRSAVTAAADYAFEVGVAVDLYRFEFLKALHVPLPSSTAAERLENRRLMALLSGDENVDIHYKHPRSQTSR